LENQEKDGLNDNELEYIAGSRWPFFNPISASTKRIFYEFCRVGHSVMFCTKPYAHQDGYIMLQIASYMMEYPKCDELSEELQIESTR